MQSTSSQLVHAITYERGGSWWFEGVASGFGAEPPPLEVVDGWEGRGEAGHLVRWIVERRGGPTFMTLYERTPRDADQHGIEAAVRKTLRVEFGALLDEYAAIAPYVYPDFWSCYTGDVAEPSWDGDYWERELALDCDDVGTFSSDDIEQPRMSARIPVTVPSEAPWRFIADHPDAELYLRPCPEEPVHEPVDDRDWSRPLHPLFIGGGRVPAGRFVLTVMMPHGEPTRVRVAGWLGVE